MSISSINASIPNSNSNSSSSIEDSSGLSMDDFFQLIAAQLQNQNMLDPVDNTEYIAQMAQFSTLSKVNEIGVAMDKMYAMSMLGKTVAISITNDNGTTETKTGAVEEIGYSSSVPYLLVDGAYYALGDVVGIAPTVATTEEAGTVGSDTTDSSSSDAAETAAGT